MAGSTVRIPDGYGPALVATGLWLGIGAGLDAYLVATHKERFITDVLRTKAGKLFMITLGLHVLNRLGPADPFRFAAKTIGNRFPVKALADITLDQ